LSPGFKLFKTLLCGRTLLRDENVSRVQSHDRLLSETGSFDCFGLPVAIEKTRQSARNDCDLLLGNVFLRSFKVLEATIPTANIRSLCSYCSCNDVVVGDSAGGVNILWGIVMIDELIRNEETSSSDVLFD
jgi:hypothetical protein